MHFNKAYTWRAACKGQRRQCIREFIVKMSSIWAWYFFRYTFFFLLFMVKSHIFAMLWLLFIRCLQIENAIRFLSQITIYILEAVRSFSCKVDTTHPWVTGFLLLRKKEITIIYNYKRNIFLTFTYINENLPNILQFIFGYEIRFEMLKTFNLKAKQWNGKCVTIGLEKNWHINICNLIIRHICYLEILIIMMQKVKQTTKLPVNETKILGHWNWTDLVPSSESRLTVLFKHPVTLSHGSHEQFSLQSCPYDPIGHSSLQFSPKVPGVHAWQVFPTSL